MTEQEWLTSTNCDAMLRYLMGGFADWWMARLGIREDKISWRKLRLFYCACARRRFADVVAWDLEWALDMAETFADGHSRLPEIAWDGGVSLAGYLVWRASVSTLPAGDFHGYVGETKVYGPPGDWAEVGAVSDGVRAAASEWPDLVREIFGNPFRPAAIEPSWMSEGSEVRRLAGAIYNTRGFLDLPILADALEEAGCRDDAILAHCRHRGPHFRGCWVVDALLAKP